MSAWLATPDGAVWMLLAGILLIYFECNRPGLVVPGCAGGLMVLLSLDSLGHAGVNAGWVAVCVAGAGMIVCSVMLRARATVAACGTLLLMFGLRFLVSPQAAGHVHWWTALPAGGCFGFVTCWLGAIALLARRNKRGGRGINEWTTAPGVVPHRID